MGTKRAEISDIIARYGKVQNLICYVTCVSEEPYAGKLHVRFCEGH